MRREGLRSPDPATQQQAGTGIRHDPGDVGVRRVPLSAQSSSGTPDRNGDAAATAASDSIKTHFRCRSLRFYSRVGSNQRLLSELRQHRGTRADGPTRRRGTMAPRLTPVPRPHARVTAAPPPPMKHGKLRRRRRRGGAMPAPAKRCHYSRVSNRGTGGPPLLLLTALAAASIASHSPHRRAAAGPGGDVTSKTTGRERVTDARGHARAEGRRARQRATGAKFRNRAWPKVHGSGDCCALLDDIGTIPPKKKNRIKGERSPDERDVRMAVRLRVATLARDTARPLVASPRRVPSSRPFVVAHKPRRRRLRSQETSKIRAPRRARDPRRTSDTAAANVNI
ncbi:unnamed protein product [Lampetra fluviatilis]